MDDERVPKPSRSESEERRRRCALMDDFEVEVPTPCRCGWRGQGPECDRGRIRAATPADKLSIFRNRWELVFGSSILRR